MSAPDTETAEAELDAAVLEHPATRPHLSLGRRGIALVAAIVALTAIAVTLAVLLISVRVERDDALAEVDTARTTAEHASAELRAVQTERTHTEVELDGLLAAADAVLAMSGPGIDPAATAALGGVRAEVSASHTETGPIEPAGALDLDHATPPQLRDYATALDEYAARLDAVADDERAVETHASDECDHLVEALAAYSTATASAGAALLTDRSDAADEVKSAMQAAIDALAAVSAADLPGTLADYRAAADAVIASSDGRRAPIGSGTIGTGFDDPTSLTVVVNKARGLPSTYAPTDLRRPAGVGNTLPLRAIAATAAERMATDMAAVGIQLRMSSGYRSYSRQETVYNGFVAREGVAGADEHSARPGHSEHQTGLAADFDDGTGCNLRPCFESAPGGRWLAENAWRYGFILRYGDGWQPTVGYRFEPWHYRFVGETTAADMHDRGILTLEEYAGLPAAPDYQ